MRARRTAVNGVELDLLESGDPDAPPVILAHGFPETSWSWRHQLPVLADAGFHAIAPDQRGYAGSSRPERVDDYGIASLCGDLIALLDEAGHEQAVFVGHDWGALIVWDLARLHPERVRAVVGVSVPYTFWPGRPVEFLRLLMGDRFFYILYFQPVGPAEAELEADPRLHDGQGALGRVRRGLQPPDRARPRRGHGLPHPGCGAAAAAVVLADARTTSAATPRPSSSPASSGRSATTATWTPTTTCWPTGRRLSSPCPAATSRATGTWSCMMAAGADERMAAELPGYRGQTLLPGVGHWTQQEAPEAFNAALLTFLNALD